MIYEIIESAGKASPGSISGFGVQRKAAGAKRLTEASDSQRPVATRMILPTSRVHLEGDSQAGHDIPQVLRRDADRAQRQWMVEPLLSRRQTLANAQHRRETQFSAGLTQFEEDKGKGVINRRADGCTGEKRR